MAVLREMSVPAIMVPEPNTWREMLAATEGRPERRIAVQEYGRPIPDCSTHSVRAEPKSTAVRIYQWDLPEDTAPLREAARRVAAGEFGAGAVHHLGADAAPVEGRVGSGHRAPGAARVRADDGRPPSAQRQAKHFASTASVWISSPAILKWESWCRKPPAIGGGKGETMNRREAFPRLMAFTAGSPLLARRAAAQAASARRQRPCERPRIRSRRQTQDEQAGLRLHRGRRGGRADAASQSRRL